MDPVCHLEETVDDLLFGIMTCLQDNNNDMIMTHTGTLLANDRGCVFQIICWISVLIFIVAFAEGHLHAERGASHRGVSREDLLLGLSS